MDMLEFREENNAKKEEMIKKTQPIIEKNKNADPSHFSKVV